VSPYLKNTKCKKECLKVEALSSNTNIPPKKKRERGGKEGRKAGRKEGRKGGRGKERGRKEEKRKKKVNLAKNSKSWKVHTTCTTILARTPELCHSMTE
jgi:hypothetical protein